MGTVKLLWALTYTLPVCEHRYAFQTEKGTLLLQLTNVLLFITLQN